MDENTKIRIYDEIFMYMTAKNERNQYINGQLTRRKMKEILVTTFSFNLDVYKQYIHNVWKTIKDEIHNEIEESKFNESFSNININQDEDELIKSFKQLY